MDDRRSVSDGGPSSGGVPRPIEPGPSPPSQSRRGQGARPPQTSVAARPVILRRDVVRDGLRRFRQQAQRNGEHLRTLRQRANVSQAAVARAIGVDRSVISRLESGDPSVGLAIRFVASELLGAELSLSAYTADAPRIYDRAHVRLVERLVRAAHAAWRVQPEAPVPGPGRRSVDVRLDGADEIVLFEVESKLGRVEEIVRECQSKVRDIAVTAGGRRVHVVLVLPPTRHNRAVVAAARETLRHVFPGESPDLLAALTVGGPWPGSGILWLGVDVRTKRTAASPAEQTERFVPQGPPTRTARSRS